MEPKLRVWMRKINNFMPITISQHYHNKISSDRLLLTIIEGKKWLVQIRTNNKIP